MDPDTCQRRLNELTTQARQLRAHRSQLTTAIDSPPTGPSPVDLEIIQEHIRDIVTNGTPQNRKALYETLIDRIEVTPDGTLIPVYRIPIGMADTATDNAVSCGNTGS
jgi:hypothetical protein